MLGLSLSLLISFLSAATAEVGRFSLPSPWSYSCDSTNSSHLLTTHVTPYKCVKVASSSASQVQGLAACKMTCEPRGTLWPAPTQLTRLSQDLLHFLPQQLKVVSVISPSEAVSQMVNRFADIFKEYLYLAHPDYQGGYEDPFSESPFTRDGSVSVTIKVESEDLSLTTETEESYEVRISQSQTSQSHLDVLVAANTYYGARHGLETLGQMITYDDLSDTLQIYSSAHVKDRPSFPHRGVLVDTSRNFMSVSVIKQIIRGLSYEKLNVFHWHITDTHSFPLYSRRVPQLTLHGAYSPRKVYTPKDIREIVDYAKVRGVRVLPEFDAPAHVGNGWQFGESAGLGRLAVCVNQEPWQDYCVEPPCGQINPVNQNVYPVLGKLYQDFFELFDVEMFHMGGDEVNLNCWNTTEEVRQHLEARGQTGTETELLALWEDFQNKAAQKVYEAAGRKVPIILWTNSLTEKGRVEQYLSNQDYIIQIWTTGKDEIIKELLDKNYKVIFSNYDAWYLGKSAEGNVNI